MLFLIIFRINGFFPKLDSAHRLRWMEASEAEVLEVLAAETFQEGSPPMFYLLLGLRPAVRQVNLLQGSDSPLRPP